MLVVDRYHPRARRQWQAAVDTGQVRTRDELALLAPEQLRPLAQLSLLLLLIGLLFFIALDIAAFVWWHKPLWINLNIGEVLVWLGINILGYFLILPVHEAIHGLAFAFWGGRPHFGTKLPLALYCGARHQLFRRNAYMVVGLAPLVGISLAGCVLTVLLPGYAAYALFALAGNLSGAAGDLQVAFRLWSLPADVLIEDTETGYRAWEILTTTDETTKHVE